MSRVVITGDRNGYPEEEISCFLDTLPNGSLVIVGDARGVDSQVADLCKLKRIECIKEKARWDLYGRAAGPIRNSKMLDYQPDFVVAFHKNLKSSKGTKNCISQAEKRGLEVKLFQ